MTTTAVTSAPRHPATHPVRRTLLRTAGTLYVAAWLVGLFAAPAAPADPSHAEMQAHAATNLAALQIQSWLVHGLAGAALLAVVLTAAAHSSSAARRRLMQATGIAAVGVSWLQVTFFAAMAAGVADATATPASTIGWYAAIDRADSVKLLLLGAFVAVATSTFRRVSPRWLTVLGAVLAPLLPVSGAAFLVDAPALDALLYLSLPLLLAWVGSLAVTLPRPDRVDEVRS